MVPLHWRGHIYRLYSYSSEYPLVTTMMKMMMMIMMTTTTTTITTTTTTTMMMMMMMMMVTLASLVFFRFSNSAAAKGRRIRRYIPVEIPRRSFHRIPVLSRTLSPNQTPCTRIPSRNPAIPTEPCAKQSKWNGRRTNWPDCRMNPREIPRVGCRTSI